MVLVSSSPVCVSSVGSDTGIRPRSPIITFIIILLLPSLLTFLTVLIHRVRAARAAQRDLLRQMIEDEVKDLHGRTRREARADAIFKWHMRVRADRKAELTRRYIARGLQARLARKQEKKRKKVERITRRLNEMVLREAPNQVVPEAP